ncbi:hypothetical protein [Nitriliruptor alkaliphilus]|uniref:hypothetical protein n=1 Tax=Nitriliruptor alkaliphilus TaxID=427918 RepID=UPI0006981D88|nr:hypothetical protein [Nitriliruptor alkaliphilus]
MIVSVAVLAVTATACTGDDDGALVLDDDGSAAPVETEPPVEVTDDPEPPPPDDDEEPLYPPLPPLEPDPDSDIPVELQEAALELHAGTYEVTQLALRTGEFDEAELSDHLAGDLLDSFVASLRSRSEGHVSLSPDTQVRWVRVVEAGTGPIVIQECRVIGPETGLYSADGERLSDAREEPEAFIFQTTYTLLEVGEDEFDYRAVEAGSAEDTELCRV